MQMAMVGLGRMGANMVRRLIAHGHQCVVFDMSPQAVQDLVREKAVGAASLEELAAKLQKPRAVWVDGPRRGRGQGHREPPAALGAGGHPHRRRQFVLHRRYPAGQAACGEADSLLRRGHQRRRVGTGEGLLHDDRGPARGGRTPGPRSSPPWPPARAACPARQGERTARAPPKKAISTAGPTAQGTSSRWCTTASSTG